MARRAGQANLILRYGEAASEIAGTAARDLKQALASMLDEPVHVVPDASVDSRSIRIGGGTPNTSEAAKLDGDSFAVSRSASAIMIDAGSERGLLHGSAALLELLGAQFPPGGPPIYPHIEVARLAALENFAVTPAFKRRAFVSDIMTWNYGLPDRLEVHLAHDREFIPWMSRRGINAFCYIRHAHDTRLRIDEVAPLLASRGIDAEYGGHVLQILMPRDLFDTHPDYFPASDDGARKLLGNLCVSNVDALKLVREGALKYVRDYPENTFLHIWGADVKRGAWCRCAQCRDLPPQLQYMVIVNAIAEALGADPPPVTYLAYHDTIEPNLKLRPLPNVWFEWAPRERCYTHAIDDDSCRINPRYLDSLKRYIEIFDGRGHVFEYYADSILFSGLGFAMPQVIADDLRCYRSLGIESISCLTFGAYSALAYPVNLEAFVRGSRAVDFDPDDVFKETASRRHPQCAAAMTDAYRAVARASRLVVDYADVMGVIKIAAADRVRKQTELAQASQILAVALDAADSISAGYDLLLDGERDVWRFSRDVLGALSEYVAALQSSGADRAARGEAAIAKIDRAAEHIQRIELPIKGTWGAYDLEWMREHWMNALRKALATEQHPAEELF